MNRPTNAFTRMDALALLAAATLLGCVVLPVLANTRPRSQHAVCANNLSRIGRAFNEWATARGDRYPMTLPYSFDGSARNYPETNGYVPRWQWNADPTSTAWWLFSVISNELTTPKVLYCPSDRGKRQATEFSLLPTGGFLHPNYQDGAVSYLLSHPNIEQGRAVLSADRRLSPFGGTAGCSYFLGAFSVFLPTQDVRWFEGTHNDRGTLLFNDGSVEQTDSVGLRRALNRPLLYPYAFHYLSP